MLQNTSNISWQKPKYRTIRWKSKCLQSIRLFWKTLTLLETAIWNRCYLETEKWVAPGVLQIPQNVKHFSILNKKYSLMLYLLSEKVVIVLTMHWKYVLPKTSILWLCEILWRTCLSLKETPGIRYFLPNGQTFFWIQGCAFDIKTQLEVFPLWDPVSYEKKLVWRFHNWALDPHRRTASNYGKT